MGTNLLTKFHDDRKIIVASRVLIRKNASPLVGHVVQPTGTIYKLVQDITGTNLFTKLHEDRTIYVAFRVLTRKNDPLSGGHFFNQSESMSTSSNMLLAQIF
ncbi:hypothetical protein DPMN_135113 [Dreissena polymorpha]|uniref:Uncharacterized protein n=1 Tax=Dreissena polymorpha TaxID=45954 RepID=A0A9D4G0X6_DREPO|nr:hypothetical protein DPMN_135113 [Dreissena polymorpha]